MSWHCWKVVKWAHFQEAPCNTSVAFELVSLLLEANPREMVKFVVRFTYKFVLPNIT